MFHFMFVYFQLPDHCEHVHRRHPGELLPGHRGRAGGHHRRGLRPLLRDLAGVRSRRYAHAQNVRFETTFNLFSKSDELLSASTLNILW